MDTADKAQFIEDFEDMWGHPQESLDALLLAERDELQAVIRDRALAVGIDLGDEKVARAVVFGALQGATGACSAVRGGLAPVVAASYVTGAMQQMVTDVLRTMRGEG